MKKKSFPQPRCLLFFCLMLCTYLPFPSFQPKAWGLESSLLEKAISEYQQERFEEALELLTDIRRQDPSSSTAAFYLGLTYKQTGNYGEAARNYLDALELSPRINNAYPELIEVLIRMERFSEAESHLLEAENTAILPDQIAFLKGILLSRTGKNDEAIQAFKTALQLNPDLSYSAELQIALLHAQEGRIRQAKNSLEALSTMAPDSDHTNFAKEYGDSLTRIMKQHKNWNFTVGAEVRYDDNVTATPSSSITGLDITHEKDTAVLNSLQIGFNPLMDRPWSLNAQLTLNTNTYKETSSHNLILPFLSLTPAYHFRKGNVSFPLLWNRSWLHGHEYTENTGVNPTLFLELYPGHMARFSAGYTRREMLQNSRFTDEDRDSDLYSAAVAYFYTFAKARGLFHLRYEHLQDKAQGANWQNQGHRYGTGVLFPVHPALRFSLSMEHFTQDYDKVHSVFGLKRTNRNTSWTAMMLWEVAPSILLTLHYTGNEEDSNIPIYAYRRNLYGIGMEYRF